MVDKRIKEALKVRNILAGFAIAGGILALLFDLQIADTRNLFLPLVKIMLGTILIGKTVFDKKLEQSIKGKFTPDEFGVLVQFVVGIMMALSGLVLLPGTFSRLPMFVQSTVQVTGVIIDSLAIFFGARIFLSKK